MDDEQELARPLAELATEINAIHEEIAFALRDALRHAAKAGRLLNGAKAQVKHGEFGTWLDANFRGSRRSAQLYMKLSDGLPAIEARGVNVAELTMSEALRQISSPTPDAAGTVATGGEGGKPTLAELEAQLEKDLPAARKTRAALIEIRDKRLYRADFPDFASYLLARCGLTEQQFNEYGDLIALCS